MAFHYIYMRFTCLPLLWLPRSACFGLCLPAPTQEVQQFFIFLERTQLSLPSYLFTPLVGTLFGQIIVSLTPWLQVTLDATSSENLPWHSIWSPHPFPHCWHHSTVAFDFFYNSYHHHTVPMSPTKTEALCGQGRVWFITVSSGPRTVPDSKRLSNEWLSTSQCINF